MEFEVKNGIIKEGDKVRFDDGFETIMTKDELQKMEDEINDIGLLWKVFKMKALKEQCEII